MRDRKFVFFSKHDILTILIICTLATLLNMFANPFLAAAVVVGGILLMRVIEHQEKTKAKGQSVKMSNEQLTSIIEEHVKKFCAASGVTPESLEVVTKDGEILELIVNDVYGIDVSITTGMPDNEISSICEKIASDF